MLCLAAPPLRAAAEPQAEGAPAPATAPAKAPAKAPDLTLDFDLLGAPAPLHLQFDDARMRRRRTMLDLHQKVGIGLVALTLATTVVGQLNYMDKYGSNAPVTGRYEATHTVLAFTTLTVFAGNGALALFTPDNPVEKTHLDRMTVHKAGMALATAGMLAQGAVGVWADQREGRIDQPRLARTHLVLGYATLAAVAVAVGALVF